MSYVFDDEFQAPPEKASAGPVGGGRPRYKTAPVVVLFYILLAVPVSLLVLLALRATSRDEPPQATEVRETVKVATPAPADPSRGVKMVNQMGRDDFRLIEGAGVDVKEGEIIACYNAGRPGNDPEFALVTTRQVIYLKDGRKTVFDFQDVVNIKDDAAFERAYRVRKVSENSYVQEFDRDIYHVEIRTRPGPRMRIDIRPDDDGPLFYDALKSALQGAGFALTPE